MKRQKSLLLPCQAWYILSQGLCTYSLLLTVSTNRILLLLGIDPQAIDDEITEEEIRMMVDEGSQRGAINQSEKEMIQKVFEFDDKSAEDVMTHRTEVSLLWLDDSEDDWEKTII